MSSQILQLLFLNFSLHESQKEATDFSAAHVHVEYEIKTRPPDAPPMMHISGAPDSSQTRKMPFILSGIKRRFSAKNVGM